VTTVVVEPDATALVYLGLEKKERSDDDGRTVADDASIVVGAEAEGGGGDVRDSGPGSDAISQVAVPPTPLVIPCAPGDAVPPGVDLGGGPVGGSSMRDRSRQQAQVNEAERAHDVC
jgi:hypothetical protein